MAKYPHEWTPGWCCDCGARIEGRDKQTLRCDACSKSAIAARCRATSAVRRAIARGALRFPQELSCVDCGARADHYEHRSYLRPLDVQPVCRSCNFNRGPAVWRNYAVA